MPVDKCFRYLCNYLTEKHLIFFHRINSNKIHINDIFDIVIVYIVNKYWYLSTCYTKSKRI